MTKPCPHCGYPGEPETKVCPHCGMGLFSIWPPPPEGFAVPLLPWPPRTLTGRGWLDFLLGAAGQYLTHLATARVLARTFSEPATEDPWGRMGVALGFVLPEMFWAVVFGLIIYYGLRRFYPVMARGSGYMTIALLVVLLGAFFTCRPLLY